MIHILVQNSVFCLSHNVQCDFDTTDAGGRENNRQRVKLESEYSWKAKRWGDGRTERGGGLGGGWHSVQRPLAERGSFI